MKYIDKRIKKEEGEAIISEFLDCFYKRKGTYPADMYKAFGSEIDDNHCGTKFSKRLIDEVLMPEQDGRCCYCMRRFSADGPVTIEHLMPNHADDKAELELYRTRPTELDGLPHTKDFKAMNPIVYPPHPHSIAYQNMVLSCNGDFFHVKSKPVCCNLKRRHSFVPPFVLHDNIADTFVYYVDGTAEWTEDPNPVDSCNNAVKILGLNNTVLKMIRRIWFFCTDNHIEPQSVGKDMVIKQISFYMSTGNELNMLLNFKNESYWSLFLEYDAFANIRHVKCN